MQIKAATLRLLHAYANERPHCDPAPIDATVTVWEVIVIGFLNASSNSNSIVIGIGFPYISSNRLFKYDVIVIVIDCLNK